MIITKVIFSPSVQYIVSDYFDMMEREHMWMQNFNFTQRAKWRKVKV